MEQIVANAVERVPELIRPSLAISASENNVISHSSFPILEEHLRPELSQLKPEVNLTIPTLKSGLFAAYQQPSGVKDHLKVLLVFKKLFDNCACTQTDISTANIPIEHYQALIRQYTIDQLHEMQQLLAKQIMSPELSQTQRQAESRCILSLFYLEQGRTDKARAQLKNAEKTPGFTLPKEFNDLYQQLKHPKKSLANK